MANRWRHYEKWNARLDRFVALGDSTCAFNPVYGQGMTSGAIAALILRDCLAEFSLEDRELPRKFFARLAKFQAQPWGLATGADFRFSGTEGHRPFISRILEPLMSTMLAVQNEDRAIGDRIGEVINMVKPPSALFEGEMLMRIAKAWARRIFRGAPKAGLSTVMPPIEAASAA